MKILDRYLLKSFLTPLIYCFCGFYIFYIGIDLIAEMDEYQSKQMGLWQVFMFYLWKTPEFLNIVTPIALLLSLIYALTRHARDHEFTAVRAAGVSRLRVSAPYLVVGVLVSFSLLFMNEFITPHSAEAAEKYSAPLSDKEGVSRERAWEMTQFNHFGSRRVWMIETFYPDTQRMSGVHIFWPSEVEVEAGAGLGGRGKMIEAESASWVDGQWRFVNGAMWETKDPQTNVSNAEGAPTRARVLRTIFDEKTIPELEETPDWIEREYRVSHVDGLRDLRKLTLSLRQMLAMGLMERDRQVWGSQFHAVLAQPWTCVVVVLIALPFGFNHGSRNATAGLATSLMIVFGYFAIQRFFHALGVGGKIEPWISAWIPNIIFASLGVILIRRSR